CLDLRALSNAAYADDDDPFVSMETFDRPQATIIVGANSYRASLDDILIGHDEHARLTSDLQCGLFRHEHGLVWCARDHPHVDGQAGQEQAIGIWNRSAPASRACRRIDPDLDRVEVAAVRVVRPVGQAHDDFALALVGFRPQSTEAQADVLRNVEGDPN